MREDATVYIVFITIMRGNQRLVRDGMHCRYCVLVRKVLMATGPFLDPLRYPLIRLVQASNRSHEVDLKTYRCICVFDMVRAADVIWQEPTLAFGMR